MPPCKIILNPAAGKGSAGKNLPLLEETLKEFHVEYDLAQTDHPWHAAELTEEAITAGFETVVAAGGDGTLNEVLNGILLSRQAGMGTACLGVLSVGRGNDFAYSMGNPTTLRQSVETLAKGHRRNIDIGKVVSELYPEGRYFGNGVGIGFDAMVGFIAARQKITGFLGYLAAALRTMYIYSPAPVMEITLDDETLTQPALMVSIMNGRRMGGGFMMTPDSLSGDGLLDVCIASEVSKPNILRLIRLFMQGTHTADPAIKMRRARKITVKALKGTLPAHADGETLCVEGSQLSIEVVPHQIEMICLKDPE